MQHPIRTLRATGLSFLFAATVLPGQTVDPNQPTAPTNPGTGTTLTNTFRRSGASNRTAIFTPGYTRLSMRTRLTNPMLVRGTNTLSGTNAPQRINLRALRPAIAATNITATAGGRIGTAPAVPVDPNAGGGINAQQPPTPVPTINANPATPPTPGS